MISRPRHGGDLDWAREAFPDAPRPWIDLSTGINPFAYPVDLRPEIWTRLPAPDALETLLESARRTYETDSAICAVPGLELAIRLLPMLATHARAVGVVGPTYASHAQAWTNAGCDVVTVASLDALPERCAIGVVVSPNNPDGRVTSSSQCLETADKLSRRGGFLVADRSFADVSDHPSALPAHPARIELRSFGKFFGLPGMRLGFVLGPEALIDRLRSLLGDWPVNAGALAVGAKALDDRAWQDATRVKLRKEAEALDRLLARPGLDAVGGTDLFRLVKVRDAAALFRHLAENGILTRAFEYDGTLIRIGLPGSEDANARLAAALEAFREKRE